VEPQNLKNLKKSLHQPNCRLVLVKDDLSNNALVWQLRVLSQNISKNFDGSSTGSKMAASNLRM